MNRALIIRWVELLTTPKGQSVFYDPISGRDVMVYHYELYDGPIGGPSYLGINYLDFSTDWPVVVD